MTALQQVHVRVNDADTKQPVPVRIRFATPEGRPFAPLGRCLRFGLGRGEDVGGQAMLALRPYFHIDGACEIALPPGIIEIEASRGPEYLPLFEKVHLHAGKLSLRLEIRRWTDLKPEGWYSGDTHCSFLAPHAALLEGAAEDLALVNLLACPVDLPHGSNGHYTAISNMLAFSGQQPALERPGHLVVVNTLNRHETLGELALLHCHRPVFPLIFGPPEGVDDWNLEDWCRQCHRKGGLVIALNYLDQVDKQGELLADALLGQLDGINVSRGAWKDRLELEPWYELLNAGLRIPLTAGSGKECNQQVLGSERTYARLQAGESFSTKAWIEAVRAGRTFVTAGPILSFVDRNPGDVIDVPGPGESIRLQVEVRDSASVQDVELLHDGRVVQRWSGGATERTARHEITLVVTEPGWVAARCVPHRGERESKDLYAHTAPIYLTVADQRRRCPAELAVRFDRRLQTMLDWVEHQGKFENDQQKQRMAGVYQRARERLKEMV